MAKRWTAQEDAFILQHHPVGLSFIGPHDLGRSGPSTIKRFNFLTESGARLAFAEMMLAQLHYQELAGFIRGETARYVAEMESEHWEAERIASQPK